MGVRGRNSSLSVIDSSGIQSDARPEPPEGMVEAEAVEWRAIVNRMPADWFPRETIGLLAQYCRHVVAANNIARMIDVLHKEMVISEKTEGPRALLKYTKSIDKLYQMQEREGRAIAQFATKMRISQSSQYDKKKKRDNIRNNEDTPWAAD